MKTIEVHRLAQRDFDRAIQYFRQHGIKNASQFIDAVSESWERIRLNPKIGSSIYRKFRFVKVPGYRYTVYYQELSDYESLVYAIAHDHRRPGYWLGRTRRP